MTWNAASVCIIILVASLYTASSSKSCTLSMSVEMPNAQVLRNGSAWDPDERVLYSPGTFLTEYGKIHGCPCMLDRPCMRKCCPKDQAMDFKNLDCIPYHEPLPWFRPNLTVDEDGSTRVAEPGEFGILYGNFCFGYLLEPKHYPEDNFVMDYDNGSLSLVRDPSSWMGPDEFCLEYFPELDTYLPYVCFSGSKESGGDETCNRLRFFLYPIGMIVSIVFLIASLSVYSIEPKLRNLCGKCMMFYMISLLCSYVSLATVQALGSSLSDNTCTAFGFIIYFSMLCTFFWLNVLCIDITLAFRSSQSISGNPVNRDKKKFIFYSLYAWGVPLLITAMTLVAELHPDIPDSILKPRFHMTCWFNDDRSRLLYFICPIGIIVLCNLCLFIYTAVNIYLTNKKNQECKTKGDKRHCKKEDRKRLKIYVKLYVVMGVTWGLEILSFLIGGSTCIWLFTDMINTLQGLFIFLILVWNRKVVALLRRRFCSKMATSEDPVTRLDESASSSDDDQRATSTDAPSGRRRDEFRLQSQVKDDGESK